MLPKCSLFSTIDLFIYSANYSNVVLLSLSISVPSNLVIFISCYLKFSVINPSPIFNIEI